MLFTARNRVGGGDHTRRGNDNKSPAGRERLGNSALGAGGAGPAGEHKRGDRLGGGLRAAAASSAGSN